MKKKTNPLKPRNRVATSPLMKKGGVHQKSQSARRQKDKLATRREVDER